MTVVRPNHVVPTHPAPIVRGDSRVIARTFELRLKEGPERFRAWFMEDPAGRLDALREVIADPRDVRARMRGLKIALAVADVKYEILATFTPDELATHERLRAQYEGATPARRRALNWKRGLVPGSPNATPPSNPQPPTEK